MPNDGNSADPGVYVTLQQLLQWREIAARGDHFDALSLFESPGGQRSTRVGDGTEFSQLRAWQRGDSARSIDWRVSARRRQPVVRQHVQPRECPLFIVVDQRPGMFFGSGVAFKSVVAAQAAALLGWSAYASGDRIGGIVLARQMAQSRCARGKQNWLQLLQSIALANRELNAQAQSALTIESAVEVALQSAPRGARVAIISDFADLNGAAWRRLGELAGRTRLLLVNVFDELERHLQLRGSLAVSDGGRQSTVSFDRALLHRYRRLRNERDERLLKWCSETLVNLSELPADKPVLNSFADPPGAMAP